MQNERIDRIMTTDPITVGPSDVLADAREILETGRMHHIPVVDGDKLVGILSASDFFKLSLLADSETLSDKLMVKHLMQTNPVTLARNSSLRDAAEAFRHGNIHALPVVEGSALVGIVTTTDVVQALLQHLPRGDGSIRAQNDEDANGGDESSRMKAVCLAAERYIHSGHAEHEHSMLVKRLDELRGSATRIL